MSSAETSNCHYLKCGLCQNPNMPHSNKLNVMCDLCQKHTTPQQQDKYWDIVCGDYQTQITETNHLTQFFQDSAPLDLALPELAMFHIFLMLTTVCRTATEFIPVCLNFMKVMSSVISPISLISHLKYKAPKHHKMLHDWLMFLKYYPYFKQTIPEFLGPVCYVSPAANPQIAKTYLIGDANSSSSTYMQETTVGYCACSHKTSCDTEEECFRHSLPADGNCNIFEVNITRMPKRYDDYSDFAHDPNTSVVSCARDFVMTRQREFERRFMRDLRYQVWLQTNQGLDSEPATEHTKEDTHRVIRCTDRMRHDKKKQKNSRQPRPDKKHTTKRGNFGKNKNNRDLFDC